MNALWKHYQRRWPGCECEECQWFRREEVRERIVDVNEVYSAVCRQSLDPRCVEYFRSRGINNQSQCDFELGFAPGSAAAATGCDSERLFEAGIVGKTESGEYFDRFRNRLIFPIRWCRDIVAFGARQVPWLDVGGGKYVNSPETEAFRKSEMLYGVDLAAEQTRSRSQLVLVEGFTDVIVARQCGIANACAAMGTSLTESHIQQLVQLGFELVLLLDGDDAGRRRSLKIADMLVAYRANARIATLAGGDPAELLLRDAQSVQDAIADAPSAMQFVINSQLRGVGPTSADAMPRLEAIAERLVHLHPVDREVFIHQLARYFGIGMNGVKKLVNSQKEKAKAKC